VADEDDRPSDRLDPAGDVGGVGRDAPERVGDRDDRDALALERGDYALPAGRVGEGSVNEATVGRPLAGVPVVGVDWDMRRSFRGAAAKLLDEAREPSGTASELAAIPFMTCRLVGTRILPGESL